MRILTVSFFMALVVMTNTTFAMEFQSARLVVWKKGASIAGEDFLAATEAVVDYLGTLPHPTGTFEYFKFECHIKSRTIHPAVINQNIGSGGTLYTPIRMVYDVKDCQKVG